MAKIELVPLGEMKLQLGEAITVGEGPKGTRMVIDVLTGEFRGERISAELATNDAADWVTLSEGGKLGALDVRATFRTDDDAFIYVEYGGRIDMEAGLLATAPTFQTGSPDYSWLNRIQAVAAGSVDLETGLLSYTLYEARVLP
jgi:hypothetical protein